MNRILCAVLLVAAAVAPRPAAALINAYTINPNTSFTVSTGTVKGNAFSVGGSTFVVTSGSVTAPRFSASTITISGDNESGCLQAGSTMTLNCANGRMGLGTSAPSEVLDVRGGVLVKRSTADNLMKFEDATTGRVGNIVHDAAGGIVLFGGPAGSGTGEAVSLGIAADHTVRFKSNSVERAQIDSAGNFGIGTASPATKLHISSGVVSADGTGADIALYVNGTTSPAHVGGGLAYLSYNDVVTTTTATGAGSGINFATMTVLANTISRKGQGFKLVCRYNHSGSSNNVLPGTVVNGVNSQLGAFIATPGGAAGAVSITTEWTQTWQAHAKWSVDSKAFDVFGGFYKNFGVTPALTTDETANITVKCNCQATVANGDCSFIDMRLEYLGM